MHRLLFKYIYLLFITIDCHGCVCQLCFLKEMMMMTNNAQQSCVFNVCFNPSASIGSVRVFLKK